VSTTHLKLTSYFAERQRTGQRFLADAMLDLFAERGVAASVMLRGIAGFGHGRFIRSDESLTLSEDPSVQISAIDTTATISALATDVAAMTSSGLITLESAGLLVDDPAAVSLPEGADEVKLTMHIGRNRRIDGGYAFQVICELLHRHRFAGACVLLGVDGTFRGERRRAHFFSRNVDVPLTIVAVGSPDQVRRAIPDLSALPHRPLITTERIQVCKRDGRLLSRPPALPAHDDQGRALWQQLMIHTSESTRHHGVPIHRALIRRLWESGTSGGATVLRGVWGFHGDHEPHGDRLIQFGRQVPVLTIIIDTPQGIARSFELVDELTHTHGLVSCETIPALMALDGGARRDFPDLADCRD
jgi:PII-like signaling protein